MWGILRILILIFCFVWTSANGRFETEHPSKKILLSHSTKTHLHLQNDQIFSIMFSFSIINFQYKKIFSFCISKGLKLGFNIEENHHHLPIAVFFFFATHLFLLNIKVSQKRIIGKYKKNCAHSSTAFNEFNLSVSDNNFCSYLNNYWSCL